MMGTKTLLVNSANMSSANQLKAFGEMTLKQHADEVQRGAENLQVFLPGPHHLGNNPGEVCKESITALLELISAVYRFPRVVSNEFSESL